MLDAIAQEFVVNHNLLAESVCWHTSCNYSSLGGKLDLLDVITEDSITAVDSSSDTVYNDTDMDTLFEFVD